MGIIRIKTMTTESTILSKLNDDERRCLRDVSPSGYANGALGTLEKLADLGCISRSLFLITPLGKGVRGLAHEVKGQPSDTVPTEPGWYRALIPGSAMLNVPEPGRWVFAEVVQGEGELCMIFNGGRWPLSVPKKWGSKENPAR